MAEFDRERRRWLGTAAGLALAGLAGCEAPPPLVRVASNAWVGYAPLFLARESGHYASANLRLLELSSNSASLMALASGQVEAAALTLDEVLVAREGGLDLKVILMFDDSAGADLVLVRPDITQPDALRGRRIAVENTATGALMLARTLESARLRPDEVVKVSLTGPMQVSAYASGQVDAVVCFEPYATQLMRLGAQRLIDSSSFPGLVVDVLAAQPAALAAAPTPFRRLLAGYFVALQTMQNAPEQALAQMAPAMGLSAQELTQALKGVRMTSLLTNHQLLGGEGKGLLGMANEVAGVMQRTGLLKRAPVLERLADARFLPTA